ncbi:MAG: hypothetical protein GY729_16320 [Desulfobacteraceae bacterium]|nr:hypothetical protein [Desulfobacteraceae bacterium]
MEIWSSIISGWVTISFIILIISFIAAFIFNIRLTVYIKETSASLWKASKEKASSGINLPGWTFNPFCLPPEFENQHKSNRVFKSLHIKALKSMKVFFACLGNFIISIILMMGSLILFS